MCSLFDILDKYLILFHYFDILFAYCQLCGIVYMSTPVAETLLSLHVRAPLEACTYMGLDSDVKPIKNVNIYVYALYNYILLSY